ncbi:methyltransferase, partial [Frankia casuarinae]
GDYDPDAERAAEAYRQKGMSVQPRSRSEVERFFDGLELVDPGVQVVHRWRADGSAVEELTDARVSIYGGVARKP